MKKIIFTSNYSMRFWEDKCAKLNVDRIVSLREFSSKFPRCYAEYYELDLFTINIHNKSLSYNDLISSITDSLPFGSIDCNKVLFNIEGNGNTIIKTCLYVNNKLHKDAIKKCRVIVSQTSGYADYIFDRYNEMMR